ncbi:DUF5712 family protein [Bacteroidetes bacterium endosymbiont of Geopemphigus sp.]|nr:DUF5712 family protein [Bacteroidetes bacterium endosymbiont of Geopemphigus sp.]
MKYFFNSASDQIGKSEVMALGQNHQGLQKSDSKFFMIIIRPLDKDAQE